MKKVVFGSLSIIFFAAVYFYARPYWVPQYLNLTEKRSVGDVLELYEIDVEQRLKPYFDKAESNIHHKKSPC